MKVGDTVWYQEKHGAPGYFYEAKILGETSRSWLVGRGNEWWAHDPDSIAKCARKLPKKGTTFTTQENAELHRWANENRHEISQQISRLKDGEILKQIAEMIGYKAEAVTR